MPTTQTSVSQQRTLLRCPKRFEYHYIRKLRPRRDDDRFLLGRAVHHFLDVYYGNMVETSNRKEAEYNGWDAFHRYVQDNFPSDDSASDQADLAEGMLHNYCQWAAENDNFIVLGTEVPFEVEVAGAMFRGIFDGIIQVGNDHWIIEHKTAVQMKTEHTLRDRQISAYVWAAHELGIPVKGVLYNTLKKSAPQQPRVLKSGKLSKSLNQNITYESYMAAIQQLGQDPEGYRDVLDQLAQRENAFFHREFVPRSPEAAGAVLRDIQQAEALKQALVTADVFPRNDTRDCSWDCPFDELCLAELEGRDTRSLLADNFKVIE